MLVSYNSSWSRTESYLELPEFQAEVAKGRRGASVHHRQGLLHLCRAGGVTQHTLTRQLPQL